MANPIILDTAAQEIAYPFTCAFLRWTGSNTAGDNLNLTESSIGNIATRVWESESDGPNYVEESLNHFHFPFGIRINAIDDGTLWIYVANRRR